MKQRYATGALSLLTWTFFFACAQSPQRVVSPTQGSTVPSAGLSASVSTDAAGSASSTVIPMGVDEVKPLVGALPEVAPAPAECEALLQTSNDEAENKKVCASQDTVMAALVDASKAHEANNAVEQNKVLDALSYCERVPTLLAQVLKAQWSPVACAEALMTPVLEKRGKQADESMRAASRALIFASRLSRMRPKADAFAPLVEEAKKPAEAQGAMSALIGWKKALEQLESDTIIQAKGAPIEFGAMARFEIAQAWIALAHALRNLKPPSALTELPADKSKDITQIYLAKIDEVTMPIVQRARTLSQMALGMGVREGINVKYLPQFASLREMFKAGAGFEQRTTLDLDLLIDEERAHRAQWLSQTAAQIAEKLPIWVSSSVLSQGDNPLYKTEPVLFALAVSLGIPLPLRVEVEKSPMNDEKKSIVALSRLRNAIRYGFRSDAEATALYKPSKEIDRLRVATATALVGRKEKLEDAKTQVPLLFDLSPLDLLAKGNSRAAHAAALNAALLALETAQRSGQIIDPVLGKANPKPAFEQAIARLEAITKRKNAPKETQERARKLAMDAKNALQFLTKGATDK